MELLQAKFCSCRTSPIKKIRKNCKGNNFKVPSYLLVCFSYDNEEGYAG